MSSENTQPSPEEEGLLIVIRPNDRYPDDLAARAAACRAVNYQVLCFRGDSTYLLPDGVRQDFDSIVNAGVRAELVVVMPS